MSEVSEHTMYKMKLHEVHVAEDGNLFTTFLRVPGGWIYRSYDKSHNIMSSSFVPFDNEFQLASPVKSTTKEQG